MPMNALTPLPLVHEKRYVAKPMQSPVGTLILVATESGLAAVLLEGDSPHRHELQIAGTRFGHPILDEAHRQILSYFSGERTAFDLPIDVGGSVFQRQVWGALLAIPYGETRSCGQVVRSVGRSVPADLARDAIGQNPLAVVVPCHRVVGPHLVLAGFSGGEAIHETLRGVECGNARFGDDRWIQGRATQRSGASPVRHSSSRHPLLPSRSA